MTDKNLYSTLKQRGLLYQCTDEEALKRTLESGEPICLYEGTDPTANSLHVGHCVPYCVLRRFQQAGHKVIVLMGGATASIGDPTGKDEMRALLGREKIAQNIEKIKKTLSVFLDFEGENKAIIVDNYSWFEKMTYIDFMRQFGVHFNISKMLASEIYNKRMENGGLTFFEMGYMPMQAYDFVNLNRQFNCTLEFGGADQWGNIVAGVELDRKLQFAQGKKSNLIGATNPLLQTPEGKKMGKTEKGAIWINKDKISAFDFYQGIYQTPDSCVRMMFALFTDIPMEEIDKMISTDIVNAKKELAYQVTAFVRGEADAKQAQEASNALFAGDGDISSAQETPCSVGENIVDVLVKLAFCKSKGEARRVLEQGGIVLNGEKVTDIAQTLSNSNFEQGFAILKKGKKNIAKLILA